MSAVTKRFRMIVELPLVGNGAKGRSDKRPQTVELIRKDSCSRVSQIHVVGELQDNADRENACTEEGTHRKGVRRFD